MVEERKRNLMSRIADSSGLMWAVFFILVGLGGIYVAVGSASMIISLNKLSQNELVIIQNQEKLTEHQKNITKNQEIITKNQDRITRIQDRILDMVEKEAGIKDGSK